MVTTLMLLLLLTTSVTTTLMGSGLQTRISSNLQNGLQATYLAGAGVQHAMYQFSRNVEWRTGIAETPLGNGTYRVTVTQSSPTADISLVATGKVAGAERTTTVTLRLISQIVAGTGVSGSLGDGGAATAAQLNLPTGIFVDTAGNLFIADQENHRIRKVAAITGIISTVAGTGSSGYSGDGGPATAAKLNKPTGIYVDTAGNLFIADQENHRVRKVTATTGNISTVAGTGSSGYSGDSGPATAAKINRPTGVFIDAAGNLFIADQENHRVRKVTAATGNISTIAGTGTSGYSGDGLLATLARLNKPTGVYVDASDNIFIADHDNNRIRKVDALLSLMSTVAGTGVAGYSGDGGLATLASINKPFSVFADAQGSLFIADKDNHRIRKVEGLLGTISTVAGTGVAADGGNDNIPTATALNFPNGVYVDTAGNFYIADTLNHRVRKVFLRTVRWQGV
jgi:sugar lactone lactonase YvrE